ncbi:hypothetical protein [Peterkaempfera bronchialis]|uniref:hypothetical protein n=1 Tax=Peterkaempfera bronchialis TaxID=2126346 RepID=UPI003C2C25BA
MAVMSADTLAGQQVDLLRQLKELAGPGFQIMFAPAEVRIADDEILVQVVDADRGVVELHPRKLDKISLGDVIHATQVVDEAFSALAGQPRAAHCWVQDHSDGGRSHLYSAD